MDDSERATAQEEVARMAALARRKKKSSDIYITGQRWNCENPTDGLFCDQYCMADHAKREEADKRAGI
jgi:hypothetical protein